MKPHYVPVVKDESDTSNFDDYPEEDMDDFCKGSPQMLYEAEFADF